MEPKDKPLSDVCPQISKYLISTLAPGTYFWPLSISLLVCLLLRHCPLDLVLHWCHVPACLPWLMGTECLKVPWSALLHSTHGYSIIHTHSHTQEYIYFPSNRHAHTCSCPKMLVYSGIPLGENGELWGASHLLNILHKVFWIMQMLELADVGYSMFPCQKRGQFQGHTLKWSCTIYVEQEEEEKWVVEVSSEFRHTVHSISFSNSNLFYWHGHYKILSI